jgi:hypothetical protein
VNHDELTHVSWHGLFKLYYFILESDWFDVRIVEIVKIIKIVLNLFSANRSLFIFKQSSISSYSRTNLELYDISNQEKFNFKIEKCRLIYIKILRIETNFYFQNKICLDNRKNDKK